MFRGSNTARVRDRLATLAYPDFEVIVVDDGFKAMCRRSPGSDRMTAAIRDSALAMCRRSPGSDRMTAAIRDSALVRGARSPTRICPM